MTLLLAWLLCNALVGALLVSPARWLVIAAAWLLVLALYTIAAGLVWAIVTPVQALSALVRWLDVRTAA